MGDPKIKNMEEFAVVSGISRPTISKYFHDPASVRKSTRARIEAALEQHDYRPNMYAINQNRRLTKNIGIIVPYSADPVFAEFSRNLETLVIEAGYRPILLSSQGARSQEIENLNSLRSIKPAGVLMAPLGHNSHRDALEAFCNDVPTVLFDSNIAGIGEAFIGHDNAQATGLICDYLCKTGEPPAFFGMRNPTDPNAFRRRETYCDVMERLGHTPQLIQVDGDGWNFEEIGYQQGRAVITEKRLPSSTILCSNDRLAIGLLAAAYETGHRVGSDEGCELRVAGHDDHPFSRYTCPSLTSVSHDYDSISKRSVELLLGLIDSEMRSENRHTKLFDGTLILRSSA